MTLMHTVRFKAGDAIVSEGAEGKTAYLIVSGSAEVSVGQGAKAKVLGTLNAGEVFGEMCLIEPGPRSATVTAVADIECVAISYDEFIASLQDDPERAVLFMKTLVRRLRQMNQRIASIDPGKRGLRQILLDWEKSLPPSRRQLGFTDPAW
jgi:CRP/FNR family transcriptional regulator, cyclic AMP receptor protein